MTDLISRDELSQRLFARQPMVLVEALGAAYFADAHLPGAINLPPDLVRSLAASLIPDRTTPIVVYCSGTCQQSLVTANRLQALGYLDVRVYSGGKEDWVEHGLPVVVDTTFGLADYPLALERLEAGRQLGKIVLEH